MAFESSAKTRSEPQAPPANQFVGNFYVPLSKELFNITEAQAESMIEPNRIADDLGRKSMAVISGFALVHSDSLHERALM